MILPQSAFDSSPLHCIQLQHSVRQTCGVLFNELEDCQLPCPSPKLSSVFPYLSWFHFGNEWKTKHIVVLMSGTEGLVALGLASNIVQFIDFTAQLCVRIKEIYTSSSGFPKELENVAGQLSGLMGVLKELAQRSEGPPLAHGVLEQCLSEAQTIDSLLKPFKAGSDRGRFKNFKLALQSLRQEKDIAKVGDTGSILLLCAMSLDWEG